MNGSPTLRTAVLVAALGLAALPATASPRTWTIAPGEPQRVGFRSHAPLESFEGSTAQVDGRIELDPIDLSAVLVEVHVDLASLDTGITMRNRHMRENHLETDRYPRATFRGDRVVEASAPALPPGETVRLRVAGTLDLHGVERPREVSLEISRLADDEGGPGLRLVAELPVALADHDIARPGFLMMKLGEVQTVFVEVTAVPDGAGGPGNDAARTPAPAGGR